MKSIRQSHSIPHRLLIAFTGLLVAWGIWVLGSELDLVERGFDEVDDKFLFAIGHGAAKVTR